MAADLIRSPVDITEEPPEKQEMIVRQGLPGRWCSGIRDNITGWAVDIGLVRDRELWRLSDATSWPDYVRRYLMDTSEGIDAVISGVRELRRRLGWDAPISETMARQAAADIMAQAPVLAEQGRPTKKDQKHKDYNVIFKRQGNSAAYLAARIKRDNPDIAAATERGEYRSVRQAAIAAGIIKPPSRLLSAQKLWDKMSDEERDAFEAYILKSKETPK